MLAQVAGGTLADGRTCARAGHGRGRQGVFTGQCLVHPGHEAAGGDRGAEPRHGSSDNDRLTSDPKIKGTVAGAGAGTVLKAGLDATTSEKYTNVSSSLKKDGKFVLVPRR